VISDIKKVHGTRAEVLEQLRPIHARLEEVGYEYRGAETRGIGGEDYLLTVWTRGDWLVRVKHFEEREMAEIAAFDKDGFLCPLDKALEVDDDALF
jgi:hypothetical protein